MKLYKMKKCNLHIRQGILLGAAENNDCSDIHEAMFASQLPLINILNRRDGVLRELYPIATQALALGAYGYAEPYHPAYFIQYEIPVQPPSFNGLSYCKHFAVQYLDSLESIYPELMKEKSPIHPFSDDKHPEFWKEIDSYSDDGEYVSLEHHIKNDLFRVVVHNNNTNNTVICSGDKEICEHTFLNAKKWDKSTSVKLIEDICKKIPELSQKEKINPFDDDWETYEEKNAWLLQKSKKDQLFRIVDPIDNERRKGAKESIEKIFRGIQILRDDIMGK